MLPIIPLINLVFAAKIVFASKKIYPQYRIWMAFKGKSGIVFLQNPDSKIMLRHKFS